VQAPPAPPIIVRIIQPAHDATTGLRDVLVGAFGLTGVIVLFAIVAGVILAGLMFFVRRWLDARA
jgi:hypothetical protein